MKNNFFVISAIALIAIAGLFVFEHVTSAQRPDRNTQPGQGQRGERPGGDRGNRSMVMNNLVSLNPVSIVENSWIDLSFKVGVDEETLMNAYLVYQATHKNFQMKMKEILEKYKPKVEEAFASGDQRAGFEAIRDEADQEVGVLLKSSGIEFQASLEKVLSKEQLTKLNELTKERQAALLQRTNRFRGGEGGQRGGQRGGEGGQRGQRPSQ